MITAKFVRVLSICLGLLIVGWMFHARSSATRQNQNQPTATREDAYRANNLGVALLEQFKYKEGADQFRRALAIDPKLSLARINLAIALFNLPELPASQREAEAAIALAPDSPQPYYILGLIARAQTRADDAVAPFQRVLKIDPNDVGANINLGQIYSQQRKYPEAIALFRVALAAEPYNTTALYNLGTTLIRAGQRPEGQQIIQRFQEFRQRGSGTALGNTYLEQGRYADAVASTGLEADLIDRSVPGVGFTDSTSNYFAESTKGAASTRSMLGGRFRSSEMNELKRRSIANALGGSVTLFDYDSDGSLDLFWTNDSDQRLYRNQAGKFTDVTSNAGALSSKPKSVNVAAVAGDYDNDGKPDLVVARDGEVALYHNEGGGRFSDVTKAAGLPAYPYLPGAVSFVDYDHDGDLDIAIAGLADFSKPPRGDEPVFPDDFAGAPNLLWRNDGNGRFSDVSAEAKLNSTGHSLAIVPTDFNNRRDIDLLVVNYGTAPELFSNQRDGSFRNVSAEVGLSVDGAWSSVAAGDLNKDGFTDFFLGRVGGPGLFAVSDGQGKFKTMPAPASSTSALATQFLDYDNDGLLDCVVLTDKGPVVLRNVGDTWADVTAQTTNKLQVADGPSGSRLFVSADLDNDGDTDLLLLSSTGQLRIARNENGNANHSIKINLTGKVSNHSGFGAKVETRAGSLAQKLESYSAYPAPAPSDLTFGLGKRNSIDAVRVLWPAGIVQSETEIAKPVAGKPFLNLSVTEIDRKPSSCPFLYSWNGERFEFITDFMGGGEMGYLEEPGRHNTPDPVEYVRITGDQLKERDGRYDLRVTNELEETLFADQFKLIAVDHPSDVEVYPNEGMSDPPKPFVLYKTQNAAPPLTAIDDHGHSVLDRISALDRIYPDDFKLHRIRGYANEHKLTMKLKDDVKGSSAQRIILLLTGWTDYAWSSDNVAASQAGKSLMLPALQVKDSRGNWKTVISDIGIPVGRPQTVTVDLTRKFLSPNREVRIVTNMRIYWDQILVDTSNGDFRVNMTSASPLSADLRWRGFSQEVTPNGREPLGYDYTKVLFTSPWKVMTGRYTREGDVREILLRSDDMFVIARPGDEISLSFDARQFPLIREGWKRTFLLYSDGFSKEMDINSASPDQVGPLPFHGMSRYPYPSSESYPLTPARRAYIDRYNTRVVSSSISAIDSVLLVSSGSK